ncbi:hypothetical protein Tco_0612359 [Tanacetum coccineum]
MLTPSGGGLILYQAYGNLYAMTGSIARNGDDDVLDILGLDSRFLAKKVKHLVKGYDQKQEIGFIDGINGYVCHLSVVCKRVETGCLVNPSRGALDLGSYKVIVIEFMKKKGAEILFLVLGFLELRCLNCRLQEIQARRLQGIDNPTALIRITLLMVYKEVAEVTGSNTMLLLVVTAAMDFDHQSTKVAGLWLGQQTHKLKLLAGLNVVNTAIRIKGKLKLPVFTWYCQTELKDELWLLVGLEISDNIHRKEVFGFGFYCLEQVMILNVLESLKARIY